MEGFRVNNFGRTFIPGRPLSVNVRMRIVDRTLKEGGDRFSGYIPVTYKFLSEQFGVSLNTVRNMEYIRNIRNIWGRYCEDFNVNATPGGGSRNSKLNQDDLKLIETSIVEKPSMSLAELVDVVSQYGGRGGLRNQNGQISVSAISRAIRSGRLPTGQRYSW